MSVGERASPKAWMAKILTAKAMERIDTAVTLTITAFKGPIFRKAKTPAKKIKMPAHVKLPPHSAATAKGAARIKPTHDRRRYALELSRSSQSPSQPPERLPETPAATVTPPKSMPALPTSIPQLRTKKDGIQVAKPPRAKVIAATAREL